MKAVKGFTARRFLVMQRQQTGLPGRIGQADRNPTNIAQIGLQIRPVYGDAGIIAATTTIADGHSLTR